MNQVTHWAALIVAAASIGCDKTDKSSDSEPKRKAGQGSALAPGSIEDLANVGRNKNGQPKNPVPPEPAPAIANNNVQPGNPAPKFNERRFTGKAKNFGVMTDKVVNYDVEIRKNPKLQIKKLRIDTSDPFSAYGTSYFTIGSRASMLNFKHQIKILAALSPNGRYPTYKQYADLKNKLRVELTKLPEYQVYAYQEKKGVLVILEDPDLKAKIQGQ